MKICLEGPQSKLNRIVYGHPAVFTTSIAALAQLQEARPNAIANCVGTAGFSLGEISALVLAKAFTFEEGQQNLSHFSMSKIIESYLILNFIALRLVEIRAEAMQIAMDESDCSAANVKCSPSSKLKLACEQAKEYCRTEKGLINAECAISGYLFPSHKIISGHKVALQWLDENKQKFGLVSVKERHQQNSGFHCALMQSVVEPIKDVLDHMDISDPIINVYSNVDGQRYSSADHIRQKLPNQIVSPIKWEQTMHYIYQRNDTNFPRTFSCGPGTDILWLLKCNNAKAWDSAVRLKSL